MLGFNPFHEIVITGKQFHKTFWKTWQTVSGKIYKENWYQTKWIIFRSWYFSVMCFLILKSLFLDQVRNGCKCKVELSLLHCKSIFQSCHRGNYVWNHRCILLSQNHLMIQNLGPSAVAWSEVYLLQSLIPTSGTFFRGDLVMKKFLRPFSLFRWFKKSSCQLLAKECALSTGKTA